MFLRIDSVYKYLKICAMIGRTKCESVMAYTCTILTHKITALLCL